MPRRICDDAKLVIKISSIVLVSVASTVRHVENIVERFQKILCLTTNVARLSLIQLMCTRVYFQKQLFVVES